MKNKTLITLIYLFSEVWKNKKQLYLLYIVECFLDVIKTVSLIILPKYIFDIVFSIISSNVLDDAIQKLIIYITLFLGIQLFINIFKNILVARKEIYNEWFAEYFENSFLDKIASMDFYKTESSKVLDNMQKAKDGIGWYSGGIIGIFNVFIQVLISLFTLLISSYIVIRRFPQLIIIQIICLIPYLYINRIINNIEIQSFSELSKTNRAFGYLFYQLSEAKFGKDIRLYDCSSMLLNKSEDYSKYLVNIWKKKSRKTRRKKYIIDFISSIRYFIIVLILSFDTYKGNITIGEFSLFNAACLEINNALAFIFAGIQEIIKKSKYAFDFIIFLQSIMKRKENHKHLLIEKKNHIIEFRNVSFKYPNTNEYILQNVSFKISEKEHVALVGINGSGKSTCIKLLCKLYVVTEGGIFFDDININDIDDDSYRNFFSVVFQDFQIFDFSIKENISFEKEISDKQLKKILLETGLNSDIQNLKDGIETNISKKFDLSGIELSGGQKQKLALGRALFKQGDILILDEPTSALDPVSEEMVYTRFNNFIKDKTAIFVSHRLSSCIFCDKIIVIDNKKVAEIGTHEELMKKNSLYKKMFDTQAENYSL